MVTILLPKARPLSEDDPIWSLTETNEITPDGKDVRRMQIIVARREEGMVEFRRDLGPAANFKHEPFMIFSMEAESAGEAILMAHQLREDTRLDEVMAEQKQAEAPLNVRAAEQVEMVSAYMKQNRRTVDGIKRRKQWQ